MIIEMEHSQHNHEWQQLDSALTHAGIDPKPVRSFLPCAPPTAAQSVRPNYFLSVRLLDPSLQQKVVETQQAVIQSGTRHGIHLAPCCETPTDLHCTLSVLVLPNEQAIVRAKEAMQTVAAQVKALLSSRTGSPLRLQLTGLCSFGTRVLWAQPDPTHSTTLALHASGMLLDKAMEDAGLTLAACNRQSAQVHAVAMQSWCQRALESLDKVPGMEGARALIRSMMRHTQGDGGEGSRSEAGDGGGQAEGEDTKVGLVLHATLMKVARGQMRASRGRGYGRGGRGGRGWGGSGRGGYSGHAGGSRDMHGSGGQPPADAIPPSVWEGVQSVALGSAPLWEVQLNSMRDRDPDEAGTHRYYACLSKIALTE